MGNVTFHPDQKQLNGSMKSDWGKIEKKRMKVFAKAYIELYGALCAYVLAVQKKDVDGLREALSSGERLFSGYYAEVQRFMQMDSRDISSEEWEDLISMVMSRGESLQEVLDPDYDFQVVVDFKENIEPVYKLCDVILSIWGFLQVPFLQKHFPGIGPGLDLAREKVLYASGKMVARLEHAGEKRGDFPSIEGSKPWKNRVSKQEVIKTYYQMDTKVRESMSFHGICQEVEKKLLQQEARPGKKAREVYSVKSIGRILKEELKK